MGVSLDHVLTFTLAAFVLIVIPGPSVLFVISRALAYGRRVALWTVFGGAAGSFVLAAAVGLGIGAIVATSAAAFTVVKFAGAGYLVYLGIQAIRHRKRLRDAFEQQLDPVSGWRSCLQGFAVAVTNPKSAVFFAAVLPQFVDPTAGPVSLQMMLFGAIFAAIVLASDSVWGVAAGAVRAWFTRSSRRLELIGGAAGLTMVGLGVGVAFSNQHE